MPETTESTILQTAKDLLLIPNDCTDFDEPILVHINMTFSTLNQLGVGPEDPFEVTKETMLSSFSDDKTLLAWVKDYIFLSVRLLFDPPASASLTDLYKQKLNEFEFRMQVYCGSELEESE